MRATLTPEQVEIQRTLREMAAPGLRDARACLEEGWRPTKVEGTLLSDFSALGLPEEAGGFGTGMVEAVLAVEALARTLTPTHLVGQLVAVHLAAAAGIDVRPAIEGGERWTPAVDEPDRLGLDDLDAAVGDGKARGEKAMVPVPGGALDAVVVVGRDGVGLVRGVRPEPADSLDPSRPLGRLELDASVDGPVGEVGDGLSRAAVLVAADLCGAAAGALDLATAYARDREQFGRPIGSFQGVAFQLADAFTTIAEAWNLCLYAAWALDVRNDDAELVAHQAKASAGRAALFAAERCIQVHGGIGITMEADPHLFLRRALAGDAWIGQGRWHDRRAGALRVAATLEGAQR